MAASKLASDILWYWHYMQKYHDAQSLVGKKYILEVEMRKFLTEATHERVIRLLNEFIEVKTHEETATSK